MEYVVFDLEWNGCYCKKLDCYINEIIEFGAVKLDENLNEISSFSSLVRPEIGKRLRNSVKDLTSITNEDLSRGAPFKYVYKRFSRFCSGCVLMTWSTSDLDSLVSNIRYHYGQERIAFMQKYADLQKYCQDRMGLSGGNAVGLQAVAEQLGINDEDMQHHRGTDDSRLTVLCLKKLYDKDELAKYIVDTDEKFYEKLFFRPYLIISKNDEDYDEKEMYFDCPECNKRAERKCRWEIKFKGFVADFECPSCGHKFSGRIQMKKKYEGVSVSRKVLKKKEEKPDGEIIDDTDSE